MNKKTVLRGPLRRKIEEYVAFRRALGFTMRNTVYIYSEFDNHLGRHYPRVRFITREMVINYLSTTAHLHTTSRGYRVTLLRGFCRYLYQKDPRNYVPERKLLPWGKRRLKPHIYRSEELSRILRRLKRIQSRKVSSATYVTVIALLAAAGLRHGEARRLNLGDADLKNGMLSIQKSKFFKSRLVPISRSTSKALIRYKLKRLGYFPTKDPSAPFFVSARGTRLNENTVGRPFKLVVRALKIRSSTGGNPRLHDLRHTFATRCLEQAYKAGNDPEARLPALATYMGHVNLKYTQTYLHPSLELLSKAGERFYQYSNANGNGARV